MTARSVPPRAGCIVSIPLFLPGGVKDNLKDYARHAFDPARDYAFGRLVEADASGGDLVEVFRYRGGLGVDAATVVASGRLFEPIHVAMALRKQRWRVVFDDPDYDREADSRYGEIRFRLGTEGDFVLWQGGRRTPIGDEASRDVADWIVHPPTKVEERIRAAFAAGAAAGTVKAGRTRR